MLRVGLDVCIQDASEPTGVERAQATLIAALEALPRESIEVVRFSPSRGVPTALWRETVLPRLMRREDVHLLHSPVAAVPLRAPLPVLATLHELPRAPRHGGPAGGDRSLRHRARTALAARHAARVICVSERTREAFCALHPHAAARAVVVHDAVDPRFHPGVAESPASGRAAGSGQRPYVLAVGRLRTKKNLAALLEAFARSRGAAGHGLVLAGPGGDASAMLRARARSADLAGRVVFAGHVDDARLVELYRGAALLAFPSLFEGFGLPVLEAMACGTPVVASEQGAAPEVRGDAALACDARDPLSIARALDGVLCSPETARDLAARGLEHARRFSASSAARKLLALYERCVREERPGAPDCAPAGAGDGRP
ncbi:MAG: glycosyltransferase family 4 protein [Planctomycetota bacterium]